MARDYQWVPITSEEFHRLLKEEENDLPEDIWKVYEQFRTVNDRAQVFRSEMYGLEQVFVVARSPEGVIYYDDVEDGFDFSPVDEQGKLTRPGGANKDLAGTVARFLMPKKDI